MNQSKYTYQRSIVNELYRSDSLNDEKYIALKSKILKALDDSYVMGDPRYKAIGFFLSIALDLVRTSSVENTKSYK